MNILFFAEQSPYLRNRVGGAENSMRLIAEGLAARGHAVTFASLRPDALPFTKRFAVNGVSVLLCPGPRRSLRARIQRRLRRAPGQLGLGWLGLDRLGAALDARAWARVRARVFANRKPDPDLLYAFYEMEFLAEALAVRDAEAPGIAPRWPPDGNRHAHGRDELARCDPRGDPPRGRARARRELCPGLQRGRCHQLSLPELARSGRAEGGRGRAGPRPPRELHRRYRRERRQGAAELGRAKFAGGSAPAGGDAVFAQPEAAGHPDRGPGPAERPAAVPGHHDRHRRHGGGQHAPARRARPGRGGRDPALRAAGGSLGGDARRGSALPPLRP